MIEINVQHIIQEEIKANIIGIEVKEVRYSNERKECIANCVLVSDDGQRYDKANVLLWEGESYDDAGQFTDEMVNSRIVEILQ
jgi:hypothetical protein